MTEWQKAAAIAAKQHGVISRAQLLGLGIGRATIPRLVSQRGWTRVHPGVYRAPGALASFPQSVTAAQLALPMDSLATGGTAAHLRGLRPAPKLIDLLIDEQDRATAPAGVLLRRTRTLIAEDTNRIDGIAVASTIRMVIDFAATAGPTDVRALLIDARQRRLLTLEGVGQRVSLIGPVRGRGVLRRLVWELDAERCDSVLEHRVRALIRDAGLPAPHPQPVEVRTAGRSLQVDIGWPRARLGIEVDGFAYHAKRQDLDADHRRSNALALAGWTILRVGWDRVERDSHRFAGEVAAMLQRMRVDRAHIRA